MLANTRTTTPQTLLNDVAPMLPGGFRFVTVTCMDGADGHDLIYHFDKNYQLHNLRMTLPRGTTLPSISHIYTAALLVENELKDLFGLTVDGLVIDFQSRLLLAEGAPTAPQNKAAAPAVAGGAN